MTTDEIRQRLEAVLEAAVVEWTYPTDEFRSQVLGPLTREVQQIIREERAKDKAREAGQ